MDTFWRQHQLTFDWSMCHCYSANAQYLSAEVSMPTFCSILWHRLLMSRSLQMSLTSSKMRSVSLSPCRSRSFRDRLRICNIRSGHIAVPLYCTDGKYQSCTDDIGSWQRILSPPFSSCTLNWPLRD